MNRKKPANPTIDGLPFLVELPGFDYKSLDRLIAHKRCAETLHDDTIIPKESTSVKTAATYISDNGEIVAKQIQQIQKHLSGEEIAQLIADYQSGKSTNQLAHEYGCNRHTIANQLKKHGIKVSRSKIRSGEAVHRIIALYENGKLIAEIAKQYEVSESAINRLLHENGVRIRSRWDYEQK